MKTLIIVSKCLRVTHFKSFEGQYEFHFKGVYAGESLKRVVLQGDTKCTIVKNGEYLLFVQLLKVEEGILSGKILKYKLLSECFDKS